MARDVRIERWLETEGVPFVFLEAMPLGRIDRMRSRANQARIDYVINPELVAEYSTAMAEGAAFPPLVGYEQHGRVILITGNHRDEAARQCGRDAFDCYLVQTEDRYVLARLTASANSIEGMRPSREDLLKHAKKLVREHGRTAKEAAAALHLPESALYEALKRDETTARLGEAATRLPVSTISSLSPIQNDTALKAAAALVKQASLPQGQVSELVKRVRAARTESEQIAAVAQMAAEPEVQARVARSRAGTVRRQPDARARLYSLLAQLEGFLREHPTQELAELRDQDDLLALRGRWNDVVGRMHKLIYREAGHGAAQTAAERVPAGVAGAAG